MSTKDTAPVHWSDDGPFDFKNPVPFPRMKFVGLYSYEIALIKHDPQKFADIVEAKLKKME